VVTALYRRYRPETFAELIGQSQVTDPLRTALRTDRVNHAYLFSGPRGCGKTTSARILARCLNCVEGPTDTPCGVCPSCVELSRDGGGSMDVVEIDAASHGGVDDARDLRERAIFAPARDRYKIFILDEAHMVTTTGFNALLKIVEEPPEHVKFIFATTEPEKVIGTIRSRTHHYPFRLVPPAQMLEYVQHLCEEESITVAPGVLPLVVRAGGGSVRDTLSLLDQLMAGSEGTNIEYERAVALLGYTHGALLDEVVDAVGARDAAAAFGAIDRIIQTGQDPRRFVEDLLERLRDLIIVAATGDGASAVLRGIPQDELERMAQQAHKFGSAELSRAADVVNAALTEMTGATSPRLHLELMVARVLVPASDETERGSLARLERLERRIGVDTGTATGTAAAPSPEAAAPSLGGGRTYANRTGNAMPSGSGTGAVSGSGTAAAAASAPERASRQPAPSLSSDAPARADAASSVGRRREPVRPNEPTPAVEPVASAPIPATTSWPAIAVPGSGAPAASAGTPAIPAASASPAAGPGVAPADPPASPADASAVAAADPSAAPAEASAPPAAPVEASAPPPAPAGAPAPPAKVTPAVAPPERSVAGIVNDTARATEVPAVESTATTPAPAASTVIPVTLQQVRDSWPEILELVEKEKRSAWIVVFSSQARALAGDVLTLTFPGENDVANFRQPPSNGESVSEYLRRAILDVLGIRVKFIARVEPTMANTAPPARTGGPSQAAAATAASAAPTRPPQAAAPQTSAPQAAASQSAAPQTAPPRMATTQSAPTQAAPPQGRPPAQTTPSQGRPPASPQQPNRQQPPAAQTASSQNASAQSNPARTNPQQNRPAQASTQQPTRPQNGAPQNGPQQTRPQQGRPQQSAPGQRERKLSDIPDSFAPPPDDYVEPIEPDLQSEYEPGGWAVASIPGGATPTPKRNEEAEKATKAAKPNLVIDPTAPPTRPFGKGTPPPKLGPGEKQRYGESVVREVLGASFIEEEPVAPRVIPMSRND
jgi:DNA polymerase-3 subunit gamma/tau